MLWSRVLSLMSLSIIKHFSSDRHFDSRYGWGLFSNSLVGLYRMWQIFAIAQYCTVVIQCGQLHCDHQIKRYWHFCAMTDIYIYYTSVNTEKFEEGIVIQHRSRMIPKWHLWVMTFFQKARWHSDRFMLVPGRSYVFVSKAQWDCVIFEILLSTTESLVKLKTKSSCYCLWMTESWLVNVTFSRAIDRQSINHSIHFIILYFGWL